MKRIVLSALLLLLAVSLAGAEPHAKNQLLFTLARTYNTNFINFEAQFAADGKFDAKDPVICYWILKEDKGQREGLNIFERKAYGFSVKSDNAAQRVVMTLNAIKDRMIKVYVQSDTARAELIINGRPSFLERIKIQSNGKMGKPPFLEAFGHDIETGEATYEKIMSK
jgi:hypothetical protein